MPSKKVSPAKRILGWLSLLAAVAFGLAVPFWLGIVEEPVEGQDLAAEAPGCLAVILVVTGVAAIFFGALIWGIVYLSGGLISKFHDPVWLSYKRRIWFANILAGGAAAVATGCFLAAVSGPLLLSLRLPPGMAFLIPALGGIFFFQFLQMTVSAWAGLEPKIVERSLAAKGFPKPPGPHWILGISDGDKSALKTFFAAEGDVGYLSLEESHLSFRGEKESFSVPREGTVLTREEDAGNVASLLGIAHAVLRYGSEGGRQALRLHPLGEWTIWRYRRRIEAMEAELGRWLQG